MIKAFFLVTILFSWEKHNIYLPNILFLMEKLLYTLKLQTQGWVQSRCQKILLERSEFGAIWLYLFFITFFLLFFYTWIDINIFFTMYWIMYPVIQTKCLESIYQFSQSGDKTWLGIPVDNRPYCGNFITRPILPICNLPLSIAH